MLPVVNTLLDSINDEQILSPDNRKRINKKIDYEIGPYLIANTKYGINYQPWRIWIELDNVYVAPDRSLTDKTLLFTDTLITEITFSFDQSANPVISYMKNGVCFLRYYNISTSSIVTVQYTDAKTPYLAMDDKRQFSSSTNDILFFYTKLNSSSVFMRMQRDSYNIEYTVGTLPVNITGIDGVGMSSANRLTLRFRTDI